MEEPLTNRRDADIDKRGAVKRRRVHTKPSMLATRPKLGNGNLQEAGGGNGSRQERNLTGDSSWGEPGGTTGPHQADGPFVWETTVGWNNLTNQTICVQEQGYVLSAYFVGYFITQVLRIQS